MMGHRDSEPNRMLKATVNVHILPGLTGTAPDTQNVVNVPVQEVGVSLNYFCVVLTSKEKIAHLFQQEPEEFRSSLNVNKTNYLKFDPLASIIKLSEAERLRPPAQQLVTQTQLAHVFGQ